MGQKLRNYQMRTNLTPDDDTVRFKKHLASDKQTQGTKSYLRVRWVRANPWCPKTGAPSLINGNPYRSVPGTPD